MVWAETRTKCVSVVPNSVDPTVTGLANILVHHPNKPREKHRNRSWKKDEVAFTHT